MPNSSETLINAESQNLNGLDATYGRFFVELVDYHYFLLSHLFFQSAVSAIIYCSGRK